MKLRASILATLVVGVLAGCGNSTDTPPSVTGAPPSASETVTAPTTSSADATFSTAAEAAGLSWSPGLVDGAHAICTALRAGDPHALVLATVQDQLGWSQQQATRYIVAATYAYCPDAGS
jgi:hypothetical protein